MSNFNQLKSMWENKGKVQTNVPPPKPLPEKFKTTQKKQITQITNSIPTRQSNQINYSESVESQSTKKSVAQLSKSLQGVLNLSLNASKVSPYQTRTTYKPQQIVMQPQQPKRDPKQIVPLKGSQRMPTFQQSKANIAKMFEKRKGDTENLKSNQINANTQEFIDLKKEDSYNNLSPEQRSEQVMKRIFSNPQSEIIKVSPELIHQQSDQTATKNTFLNNQQVATSLNLRGGKKQKKNLGDFDDA